MAHTFVNNTKDFASIMNALQKYVDEVYPIFVQLGYTWSLPERVPTKNEFYNTAYHLLLGVVSDMEYKNFTHHSTGRIVISAFRWDVMNISFEIHMHLDVG